jgi:hypothetical protein
VNDGAHSERPPYQSMATRRERVDAFPNDVTTQLENEWTPDFDMATRFDMTIDSSHASDRSPVRLGHGAPHVAQKN